MNDFSSPNRAPRSRTRRRGRATLATLAAAATAITLLPAAGTAVGRECLSVTSLRNPGWGGTGPSGSVRIGIKASTTPHRHTVDIYLSTNPTISKRDRRIGSVVLSSGESTDFTYAPGTAPVNPGSFYVVGRIRGGSDTKAAHAEAASTDPITRWLSLDLNAVQDVGERGGDDPPYEGTRMIALLTTAQYDVNVAYTGGTPYAPTGTPPRGSSRLAALEAAGYTILRDQFPKYSGVMHAAYRSAIAGLAAQPGQAAKVRAGQAFGVKVAKGILALRANDRSGENKPYIPDAPAPYVWEPQTTGPFAGVVAGDAADDVTPWVIPDVGTVAKGLKGIATPSTNPATYAAEIEEARTLGALRNTAVTTIRRTAYDTVTGPFWANDASDTYKPYGHLVNIGLWIAAQQRNTVTDNARLFGAMGAALADAATSAWHQKFTHDQPRPYFVIQTYAAIDGNPATTADPNWAPLIKPQLGGADGPPFPDYVSGHSTMAGAWGEVMTRFAAQKGWTKRTFRVSSEEFPQVTRVYDGKVRSSVGYDDNVVDSTYRSMSLEDAYSRLPAGAHTRGAARDGHAMGVVVAGYAVSRFLG